MRKTCRGHDFAKAHSRQLMMQCGMKNMSISEDLVPANNELFLVLVESFRM
jgi:hypothetical protein